MSANMKPTMPSRLRADDVLSGSPSQDIPQDECSRQTVRVAVGSVSVVIVTVDRHLSDRLEKLAAWAETNDVVWID